MASPQTIQPSLKDNQLLEGYPTLNFGTFAAILIMPDTGSRRRSPIAFDFSAVVPAGATITLGTLSLHCVGTTAARTMTVYRLLRTDWVETESTWNIYKTGSNWTTAGARSDGNDFSSTNSASAATVALDSWINVTVTAQVQTALDSVAGVAHFLLADVDAGTGNNQYASRESPTAADRPKLYIEYTVPTTGIAALKTANGLAVASIQTRNELAIASIKSWNGM
jgi:hypothetical protein